MLCLKNYIKAIEYISLTLILLPNNEHILYLSSHITVIRNYLGFLQVRVGRAESCLSKAEAFHTAVRVGLLQVEVSLLAGVAGPLLHIGLAEALGALLVTDPLRGSPQVTLAHVTPRVPVAAIATVVTLPALHPLLALALAALQAAGHVAVDCALHHAVTFLTLRKIRRREKLALAQNDVKLVRGVRIIQKRTVDNESTWHPVIASYPKVFSSHSEQGSSAVPVTKGAQMQSPVSSLQVAVGGQEHCLHSGNPKYSGSHRSHFCPIT